jgi:hypothetical protein
MDPQQRLPSASRDCCRSYPKAHGLLARIKVRFSCRHALHKPCCRNSSWPWCWPWDEWAHGTWATLQQRLPLNSFILCQSISVIAIHSFLLDDAELSPLHLLFSVLSLSSVSRSPYLNHQSFHSSRSRNKPEFVDFLKKHLPTQLIYRSHDILRPAGYCLLGCLGHIMVIDFAIWRRWQILTTGSPRSTDLCIPPFMGCFMGCHSYRLRGTMSHGLLGPYFFIQSTGMNGGGL